MTMNEELLKILKTFRIQLVATDRIDGRLAEDDLLRTGIADPEESQVLAGAGCHPTPDTRAGPAEFGTDRPAVLSGD
jgi:hypothetical protein